MQLGRIPVPIADTVVCVVLLDGARDREVANGRERTAILCWGSLAGGQLSGVKLGREIKATVLTAD